MTSKHRKTLHAIFDDPVRSAILWSDIEKLLIACGAEISEGRGSRIRVALHGVRSVFGAVRAVRRFLQEAGVTPYGI